MCLLKWTQHKAFTAYPSNPTSSALIQSFSFNVQSYSNGYKCFCHTMEQGEKRLWRWLWIRKRKAFRMMPLAKLLASCIIFYHLHTGQSVKPFGSYLRAYISEYIKLYKVDYKVPFALECNVGLTLLWFIQMQTMENFTPAGSAGSGGFKFPQ